MSRRYSLLVWVAVVAGLGLWAFSSLFAHGQITSLNIGLVVMSVGVYSAIGFACRTSSPSDYFVASRNVSPFINGMATAADWISAASFIGLTGILMTLGFTVDGEQNGGIIYLLGWTGGFVLLATVIAGKVNAYKVYSLPELLYKRFGSIGIRRVASLGSILCSGVYLVAQIYGIGLITSLLSGMTFELGVFLALGGVLLCSFLGGMRAITWTQVVQCVVIVLVMLVVASVAAWKLKGHPVATIAAAQTLLKIEERSEQIRRDPAEMQVEMMLNLRSQSPVVTQDVKPRYDESWLTPVASRTRQAFTAVEIRQAENAEAQQRLIRPVGFMSRQLSTPAQGMGKEVWINGLALIFCLMVGTSCLPHVVVRSLTVPTSDAASRSVVWAMLFVVLVYVCAISLAVLGKDVVLHDLVGAHYDQLPAWAKQLQYKKLGLLHLNDINRDGIVQFAEIGFYSDYFILGVPEILGLPSYFLGLLAVGGMAAALSTADGLLLTIANALAHDGFFARPMSGPDPVRKVVVSKMMLLIVALCATWLAAHRSVNILNWISYAFSLAAAIFFPALVMGLCWKRATTRAAMLAMVSGLGITLLYMALGNGIWGEPVRWWSIDPMSGGIFGVATGFVVGSVVTAWSLRGSRAKD